MIRNVICIQFFLMALIFNPSAIQAQGNNSDQILADLYANFGTTTFEQQYEILKRLLEGAKAENNSYNYNFALTNLSTYAYIMKDNVAFMEYTEEALDHWQNEPNLNRERIYYTAEQAITLETTKGNMKRSLELYFIMLSQLKKDTSTNEYLTEIYTDLSADYRVIGDLESAILYNQKALEVIDESNLSDQEKTYLRGSIYNIQGFVYYDKNDYSNSISNFNKSVEYLKLYTLDFSESSKNELLIESYMGLAEAYLKINDLRNANLALNTVEEYQKDFDYHKYHSLEIRGQYYIDQNLFAKGQELLDSAIEETSKSEIVNRKFPKEARIIMRMADGKKKENDLLGALSYYQKSLNYIDTLTSDDLLANPEVNNILHTKQALEILHKKAITATSILKNNKDSNSFEIASNAFEIAVKLLDKMKVNFLNQDTRHFIASNASGVYNDYIKLLTDQYERSQNDDLISMIYKVAEKNKSTIAFDELQSKYALANAKIPEDLKQEHRNLKIDIAYTERLLGELESTQSTDSGSIEKLKNKIFNLKEEFIILDQRLNRDYGKEINKKESLLKFPTMKEIQSELDHKDLLIEVFQSDDVYYFIAFGQSKYQLYKINVAELDQLLTKYIDVVSTRPDDVMDNNTEFMNLSNEIYKNTLEPIFNQFGNKERILIVPDGLLSSISFEGLITDVSNPKSFIILDYNISYLYASVQVLNESNILNEVNVLSLAPNFGGNFSNVRTCDRDSLSSLPYAKRESKFLSQMYSGSFLNSNEVTKSDLIDNINSHQIIHIATHACLNETNPMLNEIHFSDSYLTNKEIENQLASPELIVLGACNTANGKYIKGEGLLSLSKGFLQAGSKCIQSSLWSIDDYASSEIIKGMFTHLKTGASKSEALRHSKLEFLENANKLRVHPYYWAGIIQTGNDSALFKKKSSFFSNQFVILIFGLALLFGFGFFIRRWSV